MYWTGSGAIFDKKTDISQGSVATQVHAGAPPNHAYYSVEAW